MAIDDTQARRGMAEERLRILAAVDEALRRHAEVLPLIAVERAGVEAFLAAPG